MGVEPAMSMVEEIAGETETKEGEQVGMLAGVVERCQRNESLILIWCV